MISLDDLRHRAPAPAPEPERSSKGVGDYNVTKHSWGEEWEPSTSAERATKASPLAKGARSESESRILNALRKAPSASIADLARTTRLPELSAQLAWQAMMHRGGLVREEAGMLGTIRLVAVPMAND